MNHVVELLVFLLLEGECRDLSADCWVCNHLPYLNAKVKLIQSKNAWRPAYVSLQRENDILQKKKLEENKRLTC